RYRDSTTPRFNKPTRARVRTPASLRVTERHGAKRAEELRQQLDEATAHEGGEHAHAVARSDAEPRDDRHRALRAVDAQQDLRRERPEVAPGQGRAVSATASRGRASTAHVIGGRAADPRRSGPVDPPSGRPRASSPPRTPHVTVRVSVTARSR